MTGPDEMFDALAASMASRTGRTLEEWADLFGGSGVDPLDRGAEAAPRSVFEAVRAAVLELGGDVTVEGRGAVPPRSAAAVAPSGV